VRAIRGHGMMVGVELTRPCADLVAMAIEDALLINVTAGNVVRLLPPLIYGDDEVAMLVNTLGAVIDRFAALPA
jgi:acetylornithine aminotransferase